METPLYQYQPLQHSDSARILILHPSPNESDPIECTICHENLSDGSLCYEAVSYTWGNSGLTHIIHCNDAKQRLPVGRNCHAALRRLRLPKKYRKLWIDAVCINQEDLHERGHQVRIMRDVYDFASGVMVMLSDEIPDSRLLLDELVEIGKLLTPGADITRAPPSEAIVLQLESLFEDPWFKRTWVLQEVYRKGLVTIVYGSTAIKSEALRYMYFGYKSMHGCAGMQVSRTQLPLPFLIMSEGENGYSTPQFALWSRLYESRQCLATNPRDRVLALKSLVGPRQSDMDHLVDYTQSVEQCFRRVATFLLPVVGMRILTATRHPHGLDMPSWVPDWSQTLPLQRYSFWYDTIHDDNPDAEFSPPRVRIFGGALRSSLYDESYISSELRVSGFQAGRIVECSKVFQFADLDDTDMQMRQIYNQYDNIRLYLDETSKIQRPKLPDHFSGEISDSKIFNSMEYAQH